MARRILFQQALIKRFAKNEYSSFNATYISVAGTHGLIKELENESNQMVYFISSVPVLAEKPKKNFSV